MPDDQTPESRGYGQGYEYFALALGFVGAILGFGALGWLVDGWFGSRPLFAIIGSFVGGVGGVFKNFLPPGEETPQKGKPTAPPFPSGAGRRAWRWGMGGRRAGHGAASPLRGH